MRVTIFWNAQVMVGEGDGTVEVPRSTHNLPPLYVSLEIPADHSETAAIAHEVPAAVDELGRYLRGDLDGWWVGPEGRAYSEQVSDAVLRAIGA